MASMLRLLVSRHSRQPILKTAQTLLASDGIFVRTLLGHSFPYIENYTNKRDEIREKFSKNLDDIRKNLTSSQIVNNQDIDKMLHLAVTKEDVDMLFRAIQKIPNNKEKIKYLETFMDMLFYLKIKDDIVIEMLNDQEFVKNMKSYRVFRMIVNILFYNRRYEDVVRAFEIFSNEFREPLPGFNLLCKSLYMINTNEAIEKMIPLVKMYISTNQNRIAIAHLVMLCINQDQPIIADELLNMFYRNKKDISLVQNLRIIVNSKLDRAEKAMEIAENLLNNDKAMTYDLKKFFPITVKFLREVVRRSNIEDQIKRFDSFEQRLNESAELDPSDLPWILRNFSLIYLSAKKDTLNQNDNDGTNKTEPIVEFSNPIENRGNPKPIKSELKVDNSAKITADNDSRDPNLEELGRLFKQGNDNEVVELFMKLIADRKSPLPDFYLSIATTSLMKLNSKASFKKFKDLLELYSIRGFKVCDESKLHMFLLAINQNDPVYALGFVSICDIDKSNMSLFKNLKAIVHAVSNNLKGAFNEIDEIVKLPLNKFTNEGTIFPYTLKIVGEIAKKTKSNSKQLQDLEAKIEIENRLSNIDLIQLSTRQVNEKHHSRIPTSDKKTETVEKSSFISSRLEKLSLEGKDKKLLVEFIRFMNSEVNDETIGKLDKKLLNLVARAVKKSNSDIESIKKLVELLKNKPKLKFGPNFFIDMSISIINQKNPLYALEFIAEFDRDEVLKKERPTIYNNILAIGFSLIGRPEIALDQIDSIVKTRDLKPNDIYHGKVFKQAIDCLRSSVEKQQNSDLTERFTKLENSVYDNQRLCDENFDRITDA